MRFTGWWTEPPLAYQRNILRKFPGDIKAMAISYGISLLALVSMFFCQCTPKSIYLSTSGTDKDNCGNDRNDPCQSISYAILSFPLTEPNISVILLAGIFPHYINSSIDLNVKHISLLSEGGNSIIKSSEPFPSYLFSVRRSNGDGMFNMEIKNISFHKCPSILSITSNFLKRLNLKVLDVTFHESLGNPLYIHVRKPSNGDPSNMVAKVDIERTKITNNDIVIGNSNILGVLYFYAMSRVNLTVNIKDSQFMNNAIRGKGVCRGTIVVRAYNQNKVFVKISNSEFVNGNESSICIFANQVNAVEIEMKNSKLAKNKIEQKGTISIIAWLENNLFINAKNLTFSDNKAARGGAFYFSFDESNRAKLDMGNISYVNNDAEHGGSFIMKMKRSNEVTVDLSNLSHLNNRAQKAGGALAFFADESNAITINSRFSKFVNNSGEHGGALSVFPSRNNNFTIQMEENLFETNEAFLNGGAVNFYEESSDTDRNNVVRSIILKTKFLSNSARLRGGAVSLNVPSQNKFTTTITDCEFTNNDARIGGGIAASSRILYIRNTSFVANKGNRGGTLFLVGGQKNSIRNSTFESAIGNIIEASTDIEISNTSYILVDNSLSDSTKGTQVFVQHDKSLKITSPFNIKCPLNYKVYDKSTYVTKRSRLNEVVDKKRLSYLAVTCVPCKKGTYSVKHSSYSWDDSKSSKVDVSAIVCKPCPSGGNCEPGLLRSLPNYWGYLKTNDIYFIPCPIGYCNKMPISHNSCAPNREGYLCGQCIKDYSLDLLSTSCLPNNKCDRSTERLLILLLVSLPLVLVLILIFVNDLKRGLHFLWNQLKKIKLCKRCSKDGESDDDIRTYNAAIKEEDDNSLGNDNEKNDDDEDGETNEDGDNNHDEADNCDDDKEDCDDDGDRASFFTKFRLICFFYQLQRFTKVPSMIQSSFSEKFQKVLAILFSMNLIDSTENASDYTYTFRICTFQNFTFFHKKMLNLCLWIYPIILCVVIYFLISLIRNKCKKLAKCCKSLKCRLENCFIQLVLLSYIPIATSLFELIHCVTVYDNEKLNVLFSQGDIACYQWWQKGIITIVLIWIAPFAISVYVGTKLLRMKKTMLSVITILFPPISLYSMYIVHKNANREARRQSVELTNINTKNENGSAVLAINGKIGINDADISLEKDPLVNHAVDPPQDKVNGNTEELKIDFRNGNEVKQVHPLLELILGPYQLIYWPSIQILRHLLISGIFVFTDFIALRLYAMGAVLLIHLIILIFKQPYKDRVMNWLDISLSTLLLFMDIIGIFDTMRIYHIPSTDETAMLHNFFRVLKVIILIIPGILLVIYTFIDKSILERKFEIERASKE